MNIVQITPGTGGMYCGNCLRDHALVGALQHMGQQVLMLPLYLPLTLEEEDHRPDTPIFFGGINVFLEQKSALFRNAPEWVHRWLSSPTLLKWAAGKAAKTRPEETGDLTISMLRGEDGKQARELEALLQWLKSQPRPDLFCLSNALLVGLARRLKDVFGVPIVCFLAGEESFLDGLPETVRHEAWGTLAERAAEVDLFLASSGYYADQMSKRLSLPASRTQVLYNGIDVKGYSPSPAPAEPPVLGFFARMCKDKGLDTLVDAYILLRKRGKIHNLKLRVGGVCTPIDKPFVTALQARLQSHGLLGETEFLPNLDRAAKQQMLRSLSVFSVPALYGEAFGLYLLEAWASGVPVVQPRHAAFPELIDATGGGVLCAPGDPKALADALEPLLADVHMARSMGEAGRKAVLAKFTAQHMAQQMLASVSKLLKRPE